MIKHLITVVEKPGKVENATYHSDALDALRLASDVIRDQRSNLEHVRAVYDAMVQGSPMEGQE